MTGLPIIQNRLREVRSLIDGYRLKIDALEKEVVDLEVAARVLARLTSASGDQFGTEDASGLAESGSGRPEGLPSMPEMIVTVLREDCLTNTMGGDGMEPKDVAGQIRSRWWPEVNGAAVSSIMWRMWKRGDLVKHTETASYRLPNNEKAADEKSVGDTSAASLFTLAEGPETPGGGG